jgi:hypothetical protein
LRILRHENGNRIEARLDSLEMMSLAAASRQSLEARLSDDLTDSSQLDAEFGPQSLDIATLTPQSPREEQFVVFASFEHQLRRIEPQLSTIAQETTCHRKPGQIDPSTQPGPFEEMAEIRCEAVRKVDTGCRGLRAGEPLARLEAGYGDASESCAEPVSAVAGERGRAEDARHEEFVPGSQAPATQRRAPPHSPDDGHMETAMFRSCEISSYQRARISLAFADESVDQSVEDVDSQIGRCRKTQQGADGCRTHRREIGQIHRQRSASDAAPGIATETKMDVLDLRIGRENEVESRARPQDRRIITDSEGPIRARGVTRAARDTCDEV